MKIKLCFIGLYSYPIFNPDNRTAFGGAEVKLATLAKALAKISKYQVYVVVFDQGQPDVEIVEGVRIIKWKGKQLPKYLTRKEALKSSGLSLRSIILGKGNVKSYLQSKVVKGRCKRLNQLILNLSLSISYIL